MRNILKDTTNVKKVKKEKNDKTSDKDKMLSYMKDVYASTKDFDFKYDLTKCIEIIEGKENQEVTELKAALEEALIENENLLEEKVKLYMDLANDKEEN